MPSEAIKKEIHDFFRWGLPRTRHAEVLESDHWFQVSSPDFKTPSYNEVVFSSVSSDLFEQKVTDTINHYKELGTGFKWCITPYSSPSNSKQTLLDFGFKHWTSMMMCQNLENFSFKDYPNDVKVERVQPKDLEIFIDLFMKCWDLPEQDRNQMADKLYFDQERTDSNFNRFIASIDGSPAGVASMVDSGKYGYLHATAVLPVFRGCGAYKALVHERLKHLKSYGCEFAISGARAKTSGPILSKLGFEKLWDIDMFSMEFSDG